MEQDFYGEKVRKLNVLYQRLLSVQLAVRDLERLELEAPGCDEEFVMFLEDRRDGVRRFCQEIDGEIEAVSAVQSSAMK